MHRRLLAFGPGLLALRSLLGQPEARLAPGRHGGSAAETALAAEVVRRRGRLLLLMLRHVASS